MDTYHEIAYLHPKYFQKSSNILGDLNINQDSKYCVIRLVSWNATHDLGKIGLSSIELRDIISFLSGRMKIMISSERILEPDLEMYRFNLSPDLMHDALALPAVSAAEEPQNQRCSLPGERDSPNAPTTMS